MDKYEVLIKNRRDDDTETLFSGTEDDCHTYMQGWIDALIAHTAYTQEFEDGSLVFYSPLVSDNTLLVWIEEDTREE